MKKDITIITLWSDEELILDTDFDNWLKSKTNAKNNNEDWILIRKLDRYIKFSNIKDEKGKTQHLSLEAPKKEFKSFTPEERKKRDENIKNILAKTFEWRKKSFLDKRESILKDLEKQEIYFWLETTTQKLKDFSLLKIELIKKQWIK